MTHPAHGGVLLLIDLQIAIDDPSWGVRNNPRAETHQARLLTLWRANGWPVRHVRHDSVEPASTYRPGGAGHDFRSPTEPLPGEAITAKAVNSAFVGTTLEADLRGAGQTRLVVFGATTNGSVEATVRHAGNLGFEVWVIADACFTFARSDWSGALRSAEDWHAMSLGNLDGEYCIVAVADDLLA